RESPRHVPLHPRSRRRKSLRASAPGTRGPPRAAPACAKTAPLTPAPILDPKIDDLFGDGLERRLSLLHVRLPDFLGPDLNPGGDPDDHHVFDQPGVLPQARGDHDPPLLVQLDVGGSRKEEPRERPGVPLGHGQCLELFLHRAPLGLRVDEKALVKPAGDDAALAQAFPELGRNRHPAFLIEAVLVLAHEHARHPSPALASHNSTLSAAVWGVYSLPLGKLLLEQRKKRGRPANENPLKSAHFCSYLGFSLAGGEKWGTGTTLLCGSRDRPRAWRGFVGVFRLFQPRVSWCSRARRCAAFSPLCSPLAAGISCGWRRGDPCRYRRPSPPRCGGHGCPARSCASSRRIVSSPGAPGGAPWGCGARTARTCAPSAPLLHWEPGGQKASLSSAVHTESVSSRARASDSR